MKSQTLSRLNQAYLLFRNGQTEAAAGISRTILGTDPNDVEALHLLGLIEAQRNNAPAALELIDRAITLAPQNSRLHLNRSLILQQLNRLDEALASSDSALAGNPDYVRALNNRGVLLHRLNRFDEALAAYHRALSIDPRFADGWNNRSLTLQELGQFDEALAGYNQALALNRHYCDAYINRGTLLHAAGRFGEALTDYDKAVGLRPDRAEAHNNRGIALQALGYLTDALASFDRAITLKPDYAEALNNRGLILQKLGRFTDAVSSYRSALAIAPGFSEALNNLGVSLHRLNRFEEALTIYGRALAINPDAGHALCNRAQVLLVQGRIGEAMDDFRRGAEVVDDPAIHSALVFGMNFDPSASAPAKQQERRNWEQRFGRGLAEPICRGDSNPVPDRRLRIGYVSSHFRRTAAAYCFGGVIANHDGNAFDVVCYSDTSIQDDVTESIRRRASQWHDTAGLSDEQLAALVRRDRIDILVDLVGHMAGNRLAVFARKPAPVQVTAWGEPTGTGLSAMDYLLADKILVPECEAALLAEKVIHLPNFLGFWTPDPIPMPGSLPALTAGYVTFGSFNRLEKMSDAVLRSWAKIMKKSGTAHLILKDKALENMAERDRVQRTFVESGVSADRVQFFPECDRTNHFELYRQIDIALDPFPHSGGMTTLDALWMGIPVVTCPGQTISSRLAAASLSALHLDSFIAHDVDDYVEIAIARASDTEALCQLRSGLRDLIAGTEFGDPVRYSRAVEKAYREIWHRWCRG